MADAADNANDQAQVFLDRTLGQHKGFELDPGKPGDCDLCGDRSGRLIGGACARCRDRHGLP